MNKLLYTGLLAIILCFMTSCEENIDVIETETTTEETQLTLRVNDKEVLSSSVKGLYCVIDSTDAVFSEEVGVTNTGFYISELDQLDENEMHLNDFVLHYVKFEAENQIFYFEYFISLIDLGDGQGPIHVLSEFQLLNTETAFNFSELGENRIAGNFEGIIFKVDDINAEFLELIDNLEEIGTYELTFETEDIEGCREENQLSLRVNDSQVLTSDAKGTFCQDIIDSDSILLVSVSNNGYFFSELEDFNELPLEINQFILAHISFTSNGVKELNEFFISYVDLGDGQGPIYIASDLQFDNGPSDFIFTELSEDRISGTFEGMIYKIDDINASDSEIIQSQEAIGVYQLTFDTNDIEGC